MIRRSLRLPLLVWVLLFSGVTGGRAQEAPSVAILDPSPGDALQGDVEIRVDSAVEGFRSAELLFGYTNNPGTWFPIARTDEPLSSETLATWETTTLADGDYTLQLVVSLENGERITTDVTGLRVRNYTPIETSTPAPTETQRPNTTPSPQPSNTRTPPTGTPLPGNPAELTAPAINRSLARGGLIGMLTVLLLGFIIGIRTARRR